jgi:Holliday junction resolvase RusA-like endonuclease
MMSQGELFQEGDPVAPRFVELTVLGNPRTQPRPQFTTLVPAAAKLSAIWAGLEDKSWRGMRKKLVGQCRSVAREYPEGIQMWKRAILSAWLASGSSKFTGPVHVEVDIIIGRPASESKKAKAAARREWDQRKSTPGGDIDNFLKAVFDALNEWAWDDDYQIASTRVRKLKSDGSEPAHALIRIEALEPYDDEYRRVVEPEPFF